MAETVKYRVLSPVTFHAGATLGLTEAQASARRHALKALAGGLHEVLAEVQFKAGEEIGVAGEVSKAHVSSLQSLAAPAPAAAPAAPAPAARSKLFTRTQSA